MFLAARGISYDAQMCPTDSLDSDTLDKLHAIEKKLEEMRNMKPPCCKP